MYTHTRALVKELCQCQSEPDYSTIDIVITTLDKHPADKAAVSMANDLLKIARKWRLQWLVARLIDYKRTHNVRMTETWWSGIKIPKYKRTYKPEHE